MLILTEILSVNVSTASVLKLVRKEEKQHFPKYTDHLNGENPIFTHIV